MGAKKYNPEGVQSMQCKELCSASVMRYGAVQAEAQQDAGMLCFSRSIDGCRARVFQALHHATPGKAMQDRTTWRLDGERGRLSAGGHSKVVPCKREWVYMWSCSWPGLRVEDVYMCGCGCVYVRACECARGGEGYREGEWVGGLG